MIQKFLQISMSRMVKFFNRPFWWSLLSGLLFALSWYEELPSITVFFGFVPLFYVVDKLFEEERGFWPVMLYSFVAFIVWNVLATWWIWNATSFGALFAFISTSFLMTLVMAGYYFIRKHAGKTVGMYGFIALWLSYEYFSHNFDLAWPWLCLGNSLGNHAWLIQWYEYTGVLCGSLWILAVNFFISGLVDSWRNRIYGRIYWYVIDLLILIVLPVSISLYKYTHYTEEFNPVNVVVIQPNIDPYNEKFDGLTNTQQQDIMLNLAQQFVDRSTNYVVCPETAIDDRLWEHELQTNRSIARIKSFIDKNPNVMWVSGMTSMKLFLEKDTIPPTARKYPYEDGYCYDRYNSALQIDSAFRLPVYHKSKLVAGVEMMPFPKYLKFIEKFAIDMGGITGSLGTQPYRGVFKSVNGKWGVGPIICYESVFGEYVSDYIKNGASMLFVITNDGWWGNTPGYHQHLTYSRIRAIEMRRSIARSANTGVSALINQRGDVVDSLGWWKRGAIVGTINANAKITYYAKNGDYIGRIAVFVMLLAFAVAMASRFRRGKLKLLKK